MKKNIILITVGLILYAVRDPLGQFPGSGIWTCLWLLAVMVYSYILLLQLPGWLTSIVTHSMLKKLLMLALSLWLVFFALQLVLSIHDRYLAGSSGERATIPAEWDKVDIEKPVGCKDAYLWHGHAHYFYTDGFRRQIPLTPKLEDSLRVVVLGDSLTYAQGISDDDSYVSILARELQAEVMPAGMRLDVVNLGVCGANSPDILKNGYKYLSLLQPDLVVYGMCMNDFHPSGEFHAYNFRWKIPMPETWNQWLWHRTRAWRWLAEKYHQGLMRVGVRADFYADILQDWEGYQKRFADDVRHLNEFVRRQGLPPVVFMLVSQSPTTTGGGWQIATRAEDLARQAGMQVVTCAEYFKEFDGMIMKVSPWEGHPNEKAHRIFADHLKPAIADTLKELIARNLDSSIKN